MYVRTVTPRTVPGHVDQYHVPPTRVLSCSLNIIHAGGEMAYLVRLDRMKVIICVSIGISNVRGLKFSYRFLERLKFLQLVLPNVCALGRIN